MKNEIKSLTSIRGIAALMIVILHLTGNTDKAAMPLSLYSLPYKITVTFGVGIYLFFVLSAYVLSYADGKMFESKITKEKYFLFLRKRFLRVYPLYIFNVIVAAVFVAGKFDISRFIINSTLTNVLFPHEYNYNGVYWTLSAEFFIYLLFPFLYKAVKNRDIFAYILFAASMSYVLFLKKYHL